MKGDPGPKGHKVGDMRWALEPWAQQGLQAQLAFNLLDAITYSSLLEP